MRRLSTFCLLFALSLLPVQQAQAHGGAHEAELTPELLPLPPELSGLRVQLASSLGAQLLIENPGRQTLTVLGKDGRPFLRIGPGGTEANVRHPDWTDTYLPGGLPGRQPKSGGEPQWRQIKAVAAWGWFDERLKAPAAARVGTHWQIPVRLGNVDSRIAGRFRAAQSAGYWRARWLTPPRLPTGISAMLIPGKPYGLMLSNVGEQPVTVLGRGGEPFLRIGRDGTFAARNSPLWQETAAQQALRSSTGTEEAGWVRLSRGSRHTWVEPRTRPNTDAARKSSHIWQIRLRQGGQTLVLKGESIWVPVTGE